MMERPISSRSFKGGCGWVMGSECVEKLLKTCQKSMVKGRSGMVVVVENGSTELRDFV